MRLLAIFTLCLLFVPLPSTFVGASTQSDAPWGTLEIQMEGEAGEWVFAYQELPPETQSYFWEVRYTFEAVREDGAPVHALFGSPSPVFLHGENPVFLHGENIEWQKPPQLYRGNGRAAFDWPWDGPAYFGASLSGDSTVAGITILLGADAPWKLDVQIVWDRDGPVVQPDQIIRGNGTYFQFSHLIGQPLTPVVREARFDFPTTTSGFTHFEATRQETTPFTGRYVFHYATGHGRYAETIISTRLEPTVTRNGLVENIAGENWATAEYPAVGLGVAWAGAHLAMEPGVLPEIVRRLGWYEW